MRYGCAACIAIAQVVTVTASFGHTAASSVAGRAALCPCFTIQPKHTPVVTHHLIAILFALLPAAVAMWLGRGLDRVADAGALSERLAANRVRNSGVTAACATFIYMTGGADRIWALPLLIVAKMAVGYLMRRRLFGETWSFVSYVSFFTRLVIAAFGFWILLSAMPWLASEAGTRDWLVAGVLGVVLAGVNQAYGVVFAVLMRARPVDDPAIVSRFDEMVRACALKNVALLQADVRGGTFTNAVALPSTRWPAVVVSSTLLEQLDPDETVAVLGHELAHLEHYTPRRLRRLNTVTYSLIVAGALLSPVARALVPHALWALMSLWQLVLFTVMVLRAKDRQANETASDLRAVALCGTPDALARALVKIHAACRIARRWDVELERHATHPSLARRIQAIHAAAGTAPARLGASATFTGTDGSSVTFHEDRLVWNEHGTACHTIPYARLTMIRVDAKSATIPRLVAVDAADRRWELALDGGEVARAQATLDIVDSHLGAAAAPPAVSLLLPRLIAFTALTTSLTLHPWPTALIAVLAAIMPVLPVVGAAGAASVGAAAITFRESTAWGTDWQPWTASVLLAAGVLFIIVNVANRREPIPKRAHAFVWLVAAGTITSWGVIAMSAHNAIDLHRAFNTWPSATVFALALGAALAFMPRRQARYASVVALAAGLMALAVGSTAFLDRFVDDPFLAQGQRLNVRTVTGDAISEFSVPFEVNRLSISPAGGFVALASEGDDELTTIHAGAAGGPLTEFDADAAFFVDEGRLLVFERERNGSVVRLVDLEQQARSLWFRRIGMKGDRVSFDPVLRTWHVFGWSDDDDEIVSLAGNVGSEGTSEARWKAPAHEHSFTEALAVSKSDLLALETDYEVPASTRSRWSGIVGWPLSGHASYRLWTLGTDASPVGESHLDVDCPISSGNGDATLCTAYDGSRTGFFSVDAASRRLTPLVTVRGRSYVYNDAGRGWVTGWWERAPILIRAAQHEAIRVVPRTGERPHALAIGEAVLGAVTSGQDGSTIRLYSRR
jgi:Zn-dependent protease with chaperone function